MKAKVLFCIAAAGLTAIHSYGQAGNNAGAGSQGTGHSTPRDAPQTSPAGSQNRQPLPTPLQRDVRPPGLQLTNQFGLAETNQFRTFTNQLGLGTNQFQPLTNQFGLNTNTALLPTGAQSNSMRIYSTNGGGAWTGRDQPLTPADRSLLMQIQRAFPSMFRPGTSMGPVRFLVRQGTVTAVGSLNTADEKQNLLQSLANIPGVVNVVDQVSVIPRSSGGAGANSALSVTTNQFGIVTTNLAGTAFALPVPGTPFLFPATKGLVSPATNLTPTSGSNSPNRIFNQPR